MPNWVYNSLGIHGDAQDIAKIKEQLNQPFEVMHDSWNAETMEYEKKLTKYSNPVFAFWNIISPTDLDAYFGEQPKHDLTQPITFDSNHWYDWNVRNWGTKWDVGVSDNEEYPETELMDEDETSLSYRFNTAWGSPQEAIIKLSQQYPELEFNLDFEEETGWGGEIEFLNGSSTVLEEYDNKCRDCDALDTLEYCEECEEELCSSCNYLGEADLDAVAGCQTHSVYLETNVPEYRKQEA
jgi:hypothetical protein